MNTQVTILTEDLLKTMVGNRPCLVSGMPGSGKDYIADKILSKSGVVISLDEIGSIINGKWIVDIKLLKEISPDKGGLYYVGMCDNIREVYVTLCQLYPNVTPALIWIRPRPDLFRRANLLKKDLAPAGVLASWKKLWEKRSKLSDHAIEKLDENEMNFMISRLGLESAFVFENTSVSSLSDITSGWHRWDRKLLTLVPDKGIKYSILDVLSNEDYSIIRVVFDLSEPWSQYFCAITLARDTNTHSLYFWTTPYSEEKESWSTNVSLDAPVYAKLKELAIRRATDKFNRFKFLSMTSSSDMEMSDKMKKDL